MKLKKLCKTENLIVIALCWAVFFKIYKFGSIPAGFHQDELGSVYDAWSLLHFGVDKWRNPWPVYFLNYGDGQSALHTYLLLPLIAAFGISQASVRIPALCTSFLLLGSGIGVLYETWDDRWNICSRKTAILLYILIYGFAPYTQLSSRMGIDCLLMLGFSTFSIFLSLRAVRERHLRQFILAGILWGITLYTYVLTYVIVPVFLLLTFICIQRSKPLRLGQIFALAVPLFILALPLMLEQYVNMFQKDPIHLGPFTVTRLDSYRIGELTLSDIPSNFIKTLKCTLMYDNLDYLTNSRYWNFFPISVPFFFVGLIWHIRTVFTRKAREWMPSVAILIWFSLMLMLGCMLGVPERPWEKPTVHKLNGILYGVMFYIVLGIGVCFRNMAVIPWKKVAACALTVAYGCFAIHFVHYFLHYHEPTGTELWHFLYPKSHAMIQQSPSLSKKQVITSEMYYPSHVLSTLPSPLDYDFKKTMNDSWMFSWKYPGWIFQLPYLSTDEYVKKYGKGATYILREVPDWSYGYFLEEGFSEYNEGHLTMFYYDDGEADTQQNK